MCGLVAVHTPRMPVEISTIAASLAALKHRGPDGEGIWLSGDRSAGLGHARLAIIGLNNGSQPIANEDGSIHIVVNGEFYDFERIRKDLMARGHRFRTESDSEIALHLYEEHGVDCLEYLRGEFAFVIFDERKRSLFAARDRFGIKPLVFTLKEDAIYLASEAKALFAAGIEARWDEESFFHAANLQYVFPDRTLFRGVFQLRPGHYLISRDGYTETRCYWDLDYESDSPQREVTDERSIIEEFRAQLSEAVRLRLRADIPVTCHLSGGMDSSAVLALAAEHAKAPIKCFSVTFDEQSYDEQAVAHRMAKRAGAEFYPVRVTQRDLIEHLSDAVYYAEGFAVNGHLTAKYLLHKAVREAGFKVALTGEGSDEVTAGYAHLRSDLFRADGREDLLASLAATNTASKGIMLSHGETLALDAVQRRLDFVPSFLEAKGSLGHKLCSVLSKDFKDRFTNVDCYDRLIGSFNVEGQLTGRHQVHQSLYLWTKTALANYILRTLGDGTEMAHAVEGRLPFLDHHFFEFVRKLPLSMKIKGAIEKYVLREAVRDVVTDEIYRRQKHPFVAPPVSCFADPDCQALLQDTLRSAPFARLRFFDQSKIMALLDRLPSMSQEDRAAADPVLMTALSAASMHERFAL